MSAPSQRYNYAINPADMNTAAGNVMRFTGVDKTVLELGAGPGSISRPLAELNRNRMTALEYDAESVRILREFCETALQADLNDPNWPALLGEKRFDVIIMADVLEHLYNPWETLRLAAGLLAEGGSVVVSLPHAGHAVIMGCLMTNDFQYRGLGLLDKTHIRFFGMHNIQALFEDAGLQIAEYAFVTKPPAETEFAETWATLPAGIQTALQAGDFSHVYQTVVRAIPARTAADSGHYLPGCANPLTTASRVVPGLKGRISRRLKRLLKPGVSSPPRQA